MSAMDVGAVSAHDSEELIMQGVTTIGLDIAKSVFQVLGIDAEGNVLLASVQSARTGTASAS
jgi:hypothetical protein